MIPGSAAAWLLAAAVAVTAVSGWEGYRRGHAAAEAAQAATLLAQIEAGRKLDQERRRIAEERTALARQLEEEAHADPVVVDRCLSPDRVRRLNALR